MRTSFSGMTQEAAMEIGDGGVSFDFVANDSIFRIMFCTGEGDQMPKRTVIARLLTPWLTLPDGILPCEQTSTKGSATSPKTSRPENTGRYCASSVYLRAVSHKL